MFRIFPWAQKNWTPGEPITHIDKKSTDPDTHNSDIRIGLVLFVAILFSI